MQVQAELDLGHTAAQILLVFICYLTIIVQVLVSHITRLCTVLVHVIAQTVHAVINLTLVLENPLIDISVEATDFATHLRTAESVSTRLIGHAK